MKCLILGDIHGDWFAADKVIHYATNAHKDITHIIQVGDFGYGFPGTNPWEPKTSLPIHWLRGNHDNIELLNAEEFDWGPNLIYQKDNSLLTIDGYNLLFMGGATSIDKAYRTPGRSWWPEETVNMAAVRAAIERPEKIDCVFSHDTCHDFKYIEHTLPDGVGDRQALQVLHDYLKPKFWFHGHWHDFKMGKKRNTIWACAPIITDKTYLLWDGTSISVENIT